MARQRKAPAHRSTEGGGGSAALLVAILSAMTVMLFVTATVITSRGDDPESSVELASTSRWQSGNSTKFGTRGKPKPSPSTTSSTPVATTSASTSTPPTTATTTATVTPTATSSTSGTSSSPSATTSTSTATRPLNCTSSPSSCGYPDATNTGAATSGLKRVPQDVTSGPGWYWRSTNQGGYVQISTSGTTFSGYVISNGGINVDSTNGVTISNVSITWSGENFGIGLRHTTNTTISKVTVTAPTASGASRLLVGIKDVTGDQSGLQILRSDISRASTGIQTDSGLVQDNYVHDLGYTSGDHVNGTTSNGGTQTLTLRHNTVMNSYEQTDAISLFQDFAVQANKTIDDNLVAGGCYVVYGGKGSHGTSSNIRITNNRFSRVYWANSGQYGPISDFDKTGSGNVLSGNYWDDTGAEVTY